MSHDPALDATRSRVDGGVLETSGAVARPVVRRLRRRRRDGRWLDAAVGHAVGEVDWVGNWEVEEGGGLLGLCLGLSSGVGAREVEGVVARARGLHGLSLCCST